MLTSVGGAFLLTFENISFYLQFFDFFRLLKYLQILRIKFYRFLKVKVGFSRFIKFDVFWGASMLWKRWVARHEWSQSVSLSLSLTCSFHSLLTFRHLSNSVSFLFFFLSFKGWVCNVSFVRKLVQVAKK